VEQTVYRDFGNIAKRIKEKSQ